MTTKSSTSAAPLPAASRVLALCGGVGGSKLALGLSSALGADRLTLLVNTGDDFEHLGLHVSPDLDTVLYTLAGVSDPERGWGRADESWNFMAALRELGGEAWFNLGDRDLAVHVERTRRLRAGETLTAIVTDMARRLKVAVRILPMTDAPVRTIVHTTQGALSFQEYFVRHMCAPVVTSVAFEGAATAHPNPALSDVLASGNLAAIVICPSNPYLSVDPILAVPGIRAALQGAKVPIIAVSPIIGGKAVKGPTTKIMTELGIATTSQAIAGHYRGLIDGIVIDDSDVAEAECIDIPTAVVPTLMKSNDDKRRLAHAVLAFAERIAGDARVARIMPRHRA